MTLPGLTLGVIVSAALGFAFHFWRGGGLGRLMLYQGLSWAGFWAGHAAAGALGWTIGQVGALRLGPGIVGSLLFLGVGYWLSLIKVDSR